MPIDWLLILKVLRILMQILEKLPASFDHTSLASSGKDLVDLIIPGSTKGVTKNA